jgi:hypothetical protein
MPNAVNVPIAYTPQLGANNFGSMSSNTGTPGMFGTGMYQAPTFNIDSSAFVNPNYQPGAYQNAANNYLGATTGNPLQAAQGSTPGAQAQQLGLANTYGNIANGTGPNPALAAAQQQGASNLQSAESMLGSARGAGNPAQAQLAARNAQSTGAQQVAANAVPAEANQALAALGQQANIYGTVAGQQQQLGLQNAAQQNAINQANQANTLQAQTNYLNNTAAQGLANQQGQIQGQQLGVQQQLGLGNIGNQAYQNAAANNQKLAGSILQGTSGIVGGLL